MNTQFGLQIIFKNRSVINSCFLENEFRENAIDRLQTAIDKREPTLGYYDMNGRQTVVVSEIIALMSFNPKEQEKNRSIGFIKAVGEPFVPDITGVPFNADRKE